MDAGTKAKMIYVLILLGLVVALAAVVVAWLVWMERRCMGNRRLRNEMILEYIKGVVVTVAAVEILKLLLR